MLATSAAAGAKRARGSIDESDSGSSHKSLQDDDGLGAGADEGAVDDDADGADDGDGDDADDDDVGASNMEARQQREFWEAEVGRANDALPQLWKAGGRLEC